MIGGDDKISLSINSKDGSAGETAVITVDGQDVLTMDSDDELLISSYEKPAKLVRFENTSFFGESSELWTIRQNDTVVTVGCLSEGLLIRVL